MLAIPALAPAIPVADNVVPFPSPWAEPMPRAIPSPRDRMSFAEVAVALCLDTHPRNAQIIEKLRALHKYQAMPLPENPRFKSGVPCKGADNICAASFWSRRKFMAWQDGRHRTTPVNHAETRAIEARLSRNAAALARGGL